jgi:hypothetical protein
MTASARARIVAPKFSSQRFEGWATRSGELNVDLLVAWWLQPVGRFFMQIVARLDF